MAGTSKLAAILLKQKTRKDMEAFLKGILTEKEIDELTTRLNIVILLKNGISQHAIAKKLGVGVATVTRGSKELKKGRFKTL